MSRNYGSFEGCNYEIANLIEDGRSSGPTINKNKSLWPHYILIGIPIIVLIILGFHSISGDNLTPEISSNLNFWDASKLQELVTNTQGYDATRNIHLLQSCYSPNAVLVSPIALPTGLIIGAENISKSIINSRSLISDAAFIPYSLGLSTQTALSDRNALTATMGQYIHTGSDTDGNDCEIAIPMHLFQLVDEQYQITDEWQHMNRYNYFKSMQSCNSVSIPFSKAISSDVVNEVFPDIENYGWNGSSILSLVARFWSDMNDIHGNFDDDVTIEILPLVEMISKFMHEAGISTKPVAPNYPSIIINANSQEWSTVSVVVAQEVVGIDVQTGSPCSFRMEWVHAYVIQRHYRIAGLITAGNSNDFRLKLNACNKFGTREYAYNTWRSAVISAESVMANLNKNKFFLKLLNFQAQAVDVNGTVVAVSK
jgi:hypothetical protein